MSENVRLKALVEKVNIPLFNEITCFILETANATHEQVFDFAQRCLLFDLQRKNGSIQEKYGILYLGELLERYEERFGMPLPDLRAISLSLGFARDFLSQEMFVGSQKLDFIKKVKAQADDDIYLTVSLYLLGEDVELLRWEYTAAEDLIFVLSLSTDFKTTFQHFAPQLLRLLAKERTMPVLGNIGLLEWLIVQTGLMPKELRAKDMALFRALCALQKSFVKPGSKSHDILLENGYTALEIAYMNMVMGKAGRHTLLAEKMAVQLFREAIPSEEPFAPEIYEQLTWLYTQEREFSVKYCDSHKLLDALGKDITIGHADTFAWLAGLEGLRQHIFECFDIMDTKWDSLAVKFPEKNYEIIFGRNLQAEMDADEIRARIARHDELTGMDYVQKCCEKNLSTFPLLVQKGIIDLWPLFCANADRQTEIVENIGQYLQGHFTMGAYRFFEKFLEKYGMGDLSKFFDCHRVRVFDRLYEKQYSYQKAYFSLTIYRPFLNPKQHCKLLNWLQEYFFQYDAGNYTSFVKAILLDDFASALLPAEEQRALFDLVIQMQGLEAQETKALKLRYLTPEEKQAEQDAEARAEQERKQRLEAERVQHIREEFAKESGCLEDIFYFLDGYRYDKINGRTVCAVIAENLAALLKSRNYTLSQKEAGYLLRVCGVMMLQQALGWNELQNYIANIKEERKND